MQGTPPPPPSITPQEPITGRSGYLSKDADLVYRVQQLAHFQLSNERPPFHLWPDAFQADRDHLQHLALVAIKYSESRVVLFERWRCQ